MLKPLPVFRDAHLLCLQKLLHPIPWLLPVLLLVTHLCTISDFDNKVNIPKTFKKNPKTLKTFQKLSNTSDVKKAQQCWANIPNYHLNSHFLLKFNHFLPPSLLLIGDYALHTSPGVSKSDLQKFHNITVALPNWREKSSADLLTLESGIHQFWLHANSQAPRISASLAVGPCDAVHLHQTNAISYLTMKIF